MNMTRLAKIAASGMVMAFTLSGGHPVPATEAGAPSDAQMIKAAEDAAAKAGKALKKGDLVKAVAAAEEAVAYQPRDPAYRFLLGQMYMSSGRFVAAGASYADVLTLTPDNHRAALNLALAEIAQGKRDAALTLLADYREKLAPSDYGLALVLAGAVEQGVVTLEMAIRSGANTVKTRQNLALAYAVQGQWSNARVMAMQDLSPTDAGQRLVQWAAFARPRAPHDQVASLLGVTPAASDPGLPVQLALTAGPAKTVDMMLDPVPAQVSAAPLVAALPAAPAPAPVVAAEAPQAPEAPVFETPAPVAVAAPAAPLIRAAPTAIRQVIVPASQPAPRIAETAVVRKPVRAIEAGRYVVQLGAYVNAAVSRDAWNRLAPRYGLTAYDPANMHARVRGASFVRLSVGGFATRSEATAICTRIQAAGGSCFVRGRLSDVPAQWVQRGLPRAAKPVRLAAR
ncbi:MAG: SPOR domain-containing protein [Sphingomonadaceae bacterium]